MDSFQDTPNVELSPSIRVLIDEMFSLFDECCQDKAQFDTARGVFRMCENFLVSDEHAHIRRGLESRRSIFEKLT